MPADTFQEPSIMRRVSVAVGVAICLTAFPASIVGQGKRQPNIVVIWAYDVGYCDIGRYGGEITPPQLDELDKRALRFTTCFNTARCWPSRASLLTGLYSHQAGVGHMTDDFKLPGYQGGLHRNCVTIADVLRMFGYRN